MKLVAFYFLALLSVSWACFITNCPIGGKRSGPYGLQLYSNEYRRCPPCGPGSSGQCFGPSICCTPEYCVMDPVNLSTCKSEALKMTPCNINRPRCGSENKGYCALNRLCCTSESCTTDERCSNTKDRDILRESLMLN